jgi:hypothetical protein
VSPIAREELTVARDPVDSLMSLPTLHPSPTAELEFEISLCSLTPSPSTHVEKFVDESEKRRSFALLRFRPTNKSQVATNRYNDNSQT